MVMAVVKDLFLRIITALLLGVVLQETAMVHGDVTELRARYCRRDYECRMDVCSDSYMEASGRCSCHPSCLLFQDCCYNSDEYNMNCSLENNTDHFVSEILQPYVKHSQCTRDVITNNKYWMVSKCPDSWVGPNKCDVTDENTDIVVGRLEDNLSAIPMVSPDGLTFRNIYCAICHNQELSSLTAWSFTAKKCNDTIYKSNTALSTAQKVIFLNKTCEVVSFLPPKDHIHYHVSIIPCHEVDDDVIDNCNEYVTDTDVISNCSSIAAPITVMGGHSYKNKECLECRHYHSTDVNINLYEMCKTIRRPPVGIPSDCPIDKNTGRPDCPTINSPDLVPISITFNFGGRNGGVSIISGDEEIETTHVTCDVGEVFDPIASECIYLSCQKGYTLIDMKCVTIQSIIFNNDMNTCDQFTINITVETRHKDNCLKYFNNVTGCLPESLLSIPGRNLKKEYCYSMNNNTIYEYNINVTSPEVLQPILSSIVVKGDQSTPPPFCSDVTLIEVTGQCVFNSSIISQECAPTWINSSLWSINENFTNVFFKESSERVTLKELKFRHNFYFSDEPNESIRETIDVQKCHFVEDKNAVCPFIMMKASLFKPENNVSDILVYIHNTSVRFSPEMYIDYDNGSIQVCNFFQETGEMKFMFFPTYTPLETILSTIGIVLSILALSFSFLSYCIFKTLRTRIANIIIMSLCGFLLVAQLLLLLAGPASMSPIMCSIVSGLGHFFWLAAFSSSTLLGFTLVQTFSIHNQTSRGKNPSKKTIVMYLTLCLIGPFTVCGILLILFLANGDKHGITYGTSGGGCWIGGSTVNLIAFGCPVAACLLINLVFFIHVTSSICIQTRQSRRIRKIKRQWRELLIYIKIFVVLGLTWIIGFVASFTNVQFLWYLFTVMTSLQGVFIFLAFTFNSQVWDLWAKRLGLKTGGYTGVSTRSSSTMRDKYRPHSSRTTETSTV